MQIEVKQTVFPRWRGFNLLGMFCSQQSTTNRGRAPGWFDEEDFQIIEDFGFDFVRLPLSYRVWGVVNDPFKIDEAKLALPSEVVEGDELTAQLQTSLIAEGLIDEENTFLTLASTAGLSEKFLLTDNDDIEKLYYTYGIAVEKVATSRLDMYVYKPFTSLLTAPADGGSTTYTLTLHLQDKNGKTDKVTKAVVVNAPKFSLVTAEGDAFAKRIILRTNFLGNENKDKLTYQYLVGSTWTDIPDRSLKKSGSSQWVDTLRSLTPETEYSVRAVYNKNRYSEVVTLKTEKDLNIEGGNLDSWTREKKYEGNSGFGIATSKVTVYNYIVGTGWYTNNSETMGSVGATSFYLPYRCFPMVSYISNGDGKAAVIRSIGANDGNTAEICYDESRHRGKLYLGTSSGGGVSFASRPFGLKFEYKYEPYNSESFEIYAVVKNGDTVLGEAHYTSSAAQSDFEEIVVPFNYTNFTQKAGTIYICFYSSTKDQPSVAKAVTVEMENGSYKVHAGNCLCIDNVELIYE